MASSLYNQYVWLVDTIRSAGSITKSELDTQWAKSSLNTKHERTYPIRSFHRHREAVNKLFGLYICCDKLDGNKYYLSKETDHHDGVLRMHLCNTLAFNSVLLEQPELQKRVMFQPDDSGAEHLSVILSAMRAKRAVLLTFKDSQTHLPVAVLPYYLKEVNHQWILAAKPTDGNTEVQVYVLPEVATTTLTAVRGSMPRWFNADVFFASWLEMHQPAPKKETKKKEKAPKSEEPAPKKEVKKETAKQPKKQEKAPDTQAQLSLF